MAAPTFQAAGSYFPDTIALSSVTWPTHQTDDIGILIVHVAGNQTPTLTTASGFVEITHQSSGGTDVNNDEHLWIYWCRATSNSMAAVAVDDSGNHQGAQIITIRGCVNTGNPWDVFTSDSGNGTTGTIPGTTTTLADTLVLAVCSHATDTATAQFSSWTNSNLSSPTERCDNNTTAGSGGGFGAATGSYVGPGNYGSTTVTLATSSNQARVSIAFKSTSGAITGSASNTLGALTSSATGALAIAGALSATLGAATLSSASALAISGATAKTLADVTLSSAGELGRIGLVDSTLADATLSSASQLAISGALTATLDDVTCGASTLPGITATLSVTLVDLTSSSPTDIGEAVPETTPGSLRDHIIGLIQNVTPTHLPGTAFRPYRNENRADFMDWCAKNPQSAFRRYQVRDTGAFPNPEVSLTFEEGRRCNYEILVAYPQNGRYGRAQALDRGDIMVEDRHKIETAVGLRGWQNFVGENVPNATWTDGESGHTSSGAIDFVRIRQEMLYNVGHPNPAVPDPVVEDAEGATSVTLGDVTLSATGTLPIVGALAVTLEDATCTTSSGVAIQGSTSATLEAATLVATGRLAITGTASIALAACTSSSAAIHPVKQDGPADWYIPSSDDDFTTLGDTRNWKWIYTFDESSGNILNKGTAGTASLIPGYTSTPPTYRQTVTGWDSVAAQLFDSDVNNGFRMPSGTGWNPAASGGTDVALLYYVYLESVAGPGNRNVFAHSQGSGGDDNAAITHVSADGVLKNFCDFGVSSDVYDSTPAHLAILTVLNHTGTEYTTYVTNAETGTGTKIQGQYIATVVDGSKGVGAAPIEPNTYAARQNPIRLFGCDGADARMTEADVVTLFQRLNIATPWWVPFDGPQHLYLPSSSTHYSRLGVTSATEVWTFQESGVSDDAIGQFSVFNLADGTTVSQNTAVTESGWVTGTGVGSRKCWDLAHNNGNSTASSTVPDISTTSTYFALLTDVYQASNSVQRGIFNLGGAAAATEFSVQINTSAGGVGRLRLKVKGVTVDGSNVDLLTAGTVLIGAGIDRTHSLAYAFVIDVSSGTFDWLTGTYASDVTKGTFGLGVNPSKSPAGQRATWAEYISGGSAEFGATEAATKSVLKSRYQAMRYTVGW